MRHSNLPFDWTICSIMHSSQTLPLLLDRQLRIIIQAIIEELKAGISYQFCRFREWCISHEAPNLSLMTLHLFLGTLSWQTILLFRMGNLYILLSKQCDKIYSHLTEATHAESFVTTDAPNWSSDQNAQPRSLIKIFHLTKSDIMKSLVRLAANTDWCECYLVTFLSSLLLRRPDLLHLKKSLLWHVQ